jgi:hypothetical protein
VNRRLETVSFNRIIVANFGMTPANSINDRRFRISEIHNLAKNLIDDRCDWVFLTEDDTTYPGDTLNKLHDGVEADPNLAFIQGVEIGRHHTPYIGSWYTDTILNPTTVKSELPPKLNHITSITAGGFYCALTDAQLYRSHHFEPYDKTGKVGLSCDFNYGLYLKQKGYNCYSDWTIQCDHIGEKGSVNLGNTIPVQVVFTRQENKWLAETVV